MSAERQLRAVDGERTTAEPKRRTLTRSQVYGGQTIADGRRVRDNPWTRFLALFQRAATSESERREAQIAARLAETRPVTRCNLLAVVSPKGGVGKTLVTFVLGDLLAGYARLSVVAADANRDFGTLASLVPDRLRARLNLADLLERLEGLGGKPDLGPYMSKLPSGLNVLAAPEDPHVMRDLTPELYGRVLELLRQFYDVVLLDLGTGIVDDLVQFGIRRADQALIVTEPRFVTAEKVLDALPYVESESGWDGAGGGGRLDRLAVIVNHRQASSGPVQEQHVVEEAFRRAGVSRRVVVPHDEQLALMLDSGTYAHDRLARTTRLPLKEAAVLATQRLV